MDLNERERERKKEVGWEEEEKKRNGKVQKKYNVQYILNIQYTWLEPVEVEEEEDCWGILEQSNPVWTELNIQ